MHVFPSSRAGRHTLLSSILLTLIMAACGPAPTSAPTSPPPTTAGTAPTSPPPTTAGTASAAPTSPPPAATSAPAPTDPPSAPAIPALQLVADDVRQPVFATHAGDGSGRLFVVEKSGTVAILRDGQRAEPAFLDLTAIVNANGSEQGLLGLAFHPRYRENGRFFVYYTARNGDNTVARYQVSANPDAADAASGTVLFAQPDPAPNHNGGMLAFGPDGYLYVGLGDGGSAGDPWGNGQSRATLLGKILRLDVDNGEPYAIPPTNPWPNEAEVRPEIWAYGLRNPWRFSFDRASGDLYIADVGQNAYEEINFQPAGSPGGQNYGWDTREGQHCFRAESCPSEGLIDPVAEYSHDLGCSVTGGYVYRGAALPALQGAYVYGDYCSGRIWALSRDSAGAWQQRDLLATGLSISGFGEDEAGELYVFDLAGALYRFARGAPA